MSDPGRDGRWRLLDQSDTLADGPSNMATDAALLDAVSAGGPPVLRLYRWAPVTLSFGRNQPARGRYDVDAAAARGIAFVRRPTGGQAVLHDDELTYAVIAPVSVIGRPRAAYAAINEALVAGLQRLGLHATMAGAADDPGTSTARPPHGRARDWDAACFRRPERGEVVVDGAKLVGSAQRMESRTILQHGSILVGGSQAPAEELLLEPAAAGAGSANSASDGSTRGRASDAGWTTVERALGRRPSWPALADAVRTGFEAALGAELQPASLTDEEAGTASSSREHFASGEWTWRR